MEHSWVRPGVYLCWTTYWWTATQRELSERLNVLQTACCNILITFKEEFNWIWYCFHWLTLQFQTWSFSPLEEKTYTIEPTITFWPIQTPGCNKSQLPLKVVGVGAKGFIEVWLPVFRLYSCVHALYLQASEHSSTFKACLDLWLRLFPPQAERALLDVEETLVGSYRSIDVPLVNNSPCAVSFSLSVQQRLLDEQLSHDPKPEPSGNLLFSAVLCGPMYDMNQFTGK